MLMSVTGRFVPTDVTPVTFKSVLNSFKTNIFFCIYLFKLSIIDEQNIIIIIIIFSSFKVDNPSVIYWYRLLN